MTVFAVQQRLAWRHGDFKFIALESAAVVLLTFSAGG